jgi:hypothetical protein
MEATTIVRITEFYLFQCLDFSTDGHFTFTPASADGEANANHQWLAMKTDQC